MRTETLITPILPDFAYDKNDLYLHFILISILFVSYTLGMLPITLSYFFSSFLASRIKDHFLYSRSDDVIFQFYRLAKHLFMRHFVLG